MSVTFIKRSSIPVTVRGKVASGPSVTISDKGQLSLNSVSSKFLKGETKVVIGYDNGKVFIFPKGAKLVAKVPESEYFEMRTGKKNPNLAMAATNLLRSTEVFGENVYDFAHSGNQTFDATLDEKNNCITFNLPKGAMTPRPKVARKPKAKKAAGTVANPGSTVAANVADISEELVLESA